MTLRYTDDMPQGSGGRNEPSSVLICLKMRFAHMSDRFDIFFEKGQDSVAEWSKALV